MSPTTHVRKHVRRHPTKPNQAVRVRHHPRKIKGKAKVGRYGQPLRPVCSECGGSGWVPGIPDDEPCPVCTVDLEHQMDELGKVNIYAQAYNESWNEGHADGLKGVENPPPKNAHGSDWDAYWDGHSAGEKEAEQKKKKTFGVGDRWRRYGPSTGYMNPVLNNNPDPALLSTEVIENEMEHLANIRLKEDRDWTEEEAWRQDELRDEFDIRRTWRDDPTGPYKDPHVVGAHRRLRETQRMSRRAGLTPEWRAKADSAFLKLDANLKDFEVRKKAGRPTYVSSGTVTSHFYDGPGS